MNGHRVAASVSVDTSKDRQWTCEQIDELYRRALDVVEAAATDLNQATAALAEDDPEPEENCAIPQSSMEQAANVEANELTTAAQVIEALLFVGGQSLTPQTICGVLRSEFDARLVEEAIDGINQRYAVQNRPYEIRIVNGGYEIVLRPEFEPVRNRVYGYGPKQVRLSNDTLEILALIAYQQPLSRPAIDELCQRNVGAQIRQLLQRQLIRIDRGEPAGRDAAAQPVYRTTPRFLQLFGIGALDEMPHIDDVAFK
jgi:segregation and condensation protein B